MDMAYSDRGGPSGLGTVAEVENGYDGAEDTLSAGPSSAGSSTQPPSSFSHHQQGTSISSVPSFSSTRSASLKMDRTYSSEEGDGFLGDVAKWGEDGGARGGGGASVRTSRLIGGRMGLSPPPPPGPPPSEPPPLPPHQHTSRTSSIGKSSRLSAMNAFRKASGNSAGRPATPPSYPPPSSALPPIPHDTSSPASSSARKSNAFPPSSHSGTSTPRSSKRSSLSPPSSPSLNRHSSSSSIPAISPRSSSLIAPAPQDQPLGQAIALESSSAASSSSTNSYLRPAKPQRTPSRHLLQTALDLAQKAVEMDKNNDVAGALAAYREAVERLKNVMERVGVEPGGREPGRRRTSAGKSEEEGRTLRGIHDAYVARIQLLSSYETPEPEPEPRAVQAGPSTMTSTSSAQLVASTSSDSISHHPSTSTATLVPLSRSPRSEMSTSGGERTPRPSLDETAHVGIGNLMLSDADRSVDLISPPRLNGVPLGGAASPGSLDSSPRGLAINLSPRAESMSLQQALDEVAGSSSTTSSPNQSISALIRPPPRRESIGMGHPSSRRVSESGPGESDATPSPRTRRSGKHSHHAHRPSMGLENELEFTEDDEHGGMEELQESGASSRIGASPGMASFMSQQRFPPERLSSEELDRPLPPLPKSAPMVDGNGHPIIHQRQTSLSNMSVPIREPLAHGGLVSPTTASSTIVQRRASRGTNGVEVPASPAPSSFTGSSMPFPEQSPGAGGARSVTAPLAYPSRQRAKSQPGQRPLIDAKHVDVLPPLPPGAGAVRNKTSYTSLAAAAGGVTHRSGPGVSGHLRISTENSNLAPPLSVHSRSATTPRSFTHAHAPGPSPSGHAGGMLLSPLPEPQPIELPHRAFHLLRALYQSMQPDSPGCYLTGAIHISPAVWRPPPSFGKHAGDSGGGGMMKISGMDVKVRMIEALCLHFEVVRQVGGVLLQGTREGMYGKRQGGRADAGTMRCADEMAAQLSEVEEEMEGWWKGLTKAGVAVGGWRGKKTGGGKSWGSRISRGMDKMTNGKGLDSPDKYVDLLAGLCSGSQVINEHLLNFTGPCTPAYHTLPENTYRALEMRVGRVAEFVSAVVVPFVLDDFKQFFLRYLKGGMRYLEE